MRGIDWDKVRRNRNVWKPDYRERFKEDRALAGFQIKSYRKDAPKNEDSVTTTRFSQMRPQTAREIRLHLVALGLKGKKLRETVDDLLTGKQHISWVECDIQVNKLFQQGFEPIIDEYKDNPLQMRFIKLNATGEIETECIIKFSKPTK